MLMFLFNCYGLMSVFCIVEVGITCFVFMCCRIVVFVLACFGISGFRILSILSLKPVFGLTSMNSQGYHTIEISPPSTHLLAISNLYSLAFETQLLIQVVYLFLPSLMTIISINCISNFGSFGFMLLLNYVPFLKDAIQ